MLNYILGVTNNECGISSRQTMQLLFSAAYAALIHGRTKRCEEMLDETQLNRLKIIQSMNST
jgi:hypothetical protein